MGFDAEKIIPPGANIKVIGIGGGGGNAVNTMIRSNLEGVEFLAANTDVQALRFALPENKIQIGKELTKGLGAGADPDVGRDAALEDRHEIQEAISGADMVFITAGMGGGTGTGGASVVAQIAREMGALTVAVVTKPFNFEGKRRRRHADLGIERLRECVDTLITIPNQRLLQIATPDLSMVDAFRMADDVLVNAVKGISDIINVPGTVNVDFADVKTVMSSMGLALMGIGRSSGEGRATEAAKQAICSPLLEDVDIEGATGILINITAGSNISLMEVNEACSIIQDAAHEDANIIFGAVIDENCADEIRVTVIATGFPADYEETDETPRANMFGGGRRHMEHAKHRYATSTPSRPQPIPTIPRAQPMAQQYAPPPVAVPAPMHEPVLAEEAPKPQHEVKEPVAAEMEEFGTNIEHNELEDLTNLTMQQRDEEAFIEAEYPTLEQPETENEFTPEQQPPLQTPTLGKDDSEEEQAEVPTLAAESPMDEEANETHAYDLSAEVETQGVPAEAPTENHERTTPAPMESFFAEEIDSQESLSLGEFDQKIDEALELAERLKGAMSEDTFLSSYDQEEDDPKLDVPSYLRGEPKDFSLD